MKPLTPGENSLVTKTQMRSSSKPRTKQRGEPNTTKKTPFPLTVTNAVLSLSKQKRPHGSVRVCAGGATIEEPRKPSGFGGNGSLVGWKTNGVWVKCSQDAFGRFLALARKNQENRFCRRKRIRSCGEGFFFDRERKDSKEGERARGI